MPLSPGDHLGPYRILARIGAGGMGEVWKARDPRLNRDVAIKVSAAHFSERFEREAKAIAALNHPNICQIYDVGPNYLVMEYIEGAPLKGPLPVAEALRHAAQICSALDAAHKKGITHRDLKPANILVAKSGIKLLDFGLAKLSRDSYGAGSASTTPGADPENTPTLTMALTGKNEIVGTLYYMSPEQLQAQATGKEIDSRSDIFSFGLVLYEMLTGKRAMDGSSPASVIAAILERPAPSISDIAPPALDRVLKICLAKDPDERWQTARDLKRELEWIASGSGDATLPSRDSNGAGSSSRLSKLWPGIAALMTLLAAGVAGYFLTRPASPPLATQFTLLAPPQAAFTNPYGATAVSPDGRFVVFGASSGSTAPVLWLRPLDSLAARPLPGTEGGNFPFWSPDSKSIAFVAGGKVKRVEIVGGAPLVLCDTAASGNGSVSGTWNRDGVILFGATDGLYRVPASGGMPALLTKIDAAQQETGHGYPQFLPDGKRFLYFVESSNPSTEGMYASSLDRPRERMLVVRTAAKAVYVPPVEGRPGTLVWLREQSLLAQRFDAANLRLEGDPAPLTEDISLNGHRAAFWISDAGLLVYRTGAAPRSKLAWIARDGKRLPDATPEDNYSSLRLSPDGKRVAIVRRLGSSVDSDDVWLLEFARNIWTRFTFDPKIDRSPVWSPDGRQIAFISDRTGSNQLYRKDAGGAGQDELLTSGPANKYLTDWSRDGRYLLYYESGPKTGFDLWALPLEGERKPMLVLQTPFDELFGRFSPDGRWVAYLSNESGQNQVYVQAFPGAPSAPKGKWQVSSQGGYFAPAWRGDGKEIYFVSQDNKMMAAGIRATAAGVEVETPRELFTTSVPSGTNFPYDVTADGQRFLVEELSGAANEAPLTVQVHWQAALK